MKMRFALLLSGVVLLGVSLAMASNSMPGMGTGGHSFAPQVSSCVGDFSASTGVCNIFEEPDNAEVQDFNLGTPNVNTGLVDIYDPDRVTLSDSLDFYLNADGNVHLLFQSDGFAQSGGAFGGTEDAAGNWVYSVGNVYMGVSPPEVPEPSSLILLGSGILGIAGVVRRRLL
jgi:PEP-CTERM motif